MKIDEIVKKYQSDGLKGFAVFIVGFEKKGAIEQLTQKHDIKIPLVILKGGKMDEALRTYRINLNAANTIFISKSNRVLFKRVNATAETFGGIEAAVKGMLGK